MLRNAPAFLVLLLASATSMAAQEIRGTVMEAGSRQALSGAVVTATSLDDAVIATALTDSTGRFVLPVPADDSLRLRVERMDYATLESVPVALEPGEPLELEIQLRPRPVDVGEVKAVARRQRSGFGWYLDDEELTRNPPATATWAMLRLPHVTLTGRGIRVMGPNPRTQSIGSEGGNLCNPTIYIDGSFQDIPTDQLDSWVAGPSIRAVELYRDRNHAPPEYLLPGRENCAIVLIWTEQALGSRAASQWPWQARGNGAG